jgi:hypothetical protein
MYLSVTKLATACCSDAFLQPLGLIHSVGKFLGEFAELRKTTISFSMSVCLSVCISFSLSVRMECLGFHWTDFHEIWYLKNV